MTLLSAAPKVGPFVPCPLLRLLKPPLPNHLMVAGEQYLWHVVTAKISRSRILRILKQVVRKRLFLRRLLVAEHARYQPSHSIDKSHCRDLATTEYIVAYGYLKRGQLGSNPFVETFVMTGDKQEPFTACQRARHALIKPPALRTEQNYFIDRSALAADIFNGVKDGATHHHHARAATVWPIIHATMLVLGVIANVGEHNLDQPLVLRPLDDRCTEHGAAHLRKQSQYVYSHRTPLGLPQRRVWLGYSAEGSTESCGAAVACGSALPDETPVLDDLPLPTTTSIPFLRNRSRTVSLG